MKKLVWYPWSSVKLIQEFPRAVEIVESQIDNLPEESKEKNIAAIQSFKLSPLTLDEIKSSKRSKDLITIAYAANFIARTVDADETLDENLGLLQVAHEIFRSLNRLTQPDKAMHQSVQDTISLLVDSGMEQIMAGDADAGILIENIDEFVKSVWGSTTSQFKLIINEMILSKLEQVRVSRENDKVFHKLFIQNNIEAVLQLEVPARLEKVLETWIEIGEHVAPTAARIAQRKYKRPDKLSELLNLDILGKIQTAVEEGDSEKLESALALCEEGLESNLRLRLNAKPEYIEPISEIRNKSEIDRFFDQARRLLMEQNSSALDRFRDIHFHRPGHTAAKEWYAYALILFGHSTDIHEIIELLQDAISSDFFRLEFGWSARWNLACALRRLPKRAKEALDVLLPVLDLDFHTPDSFELCLLWAFEQDRRDVLSPILLKSPFHEAHLLAALYDIRNPFQNEKKTIHTHFLRIGRILRDIDHVFPDPAERLGESELDRLTQEFIQNSLLDAGIEWFRQRLSIGREKNFYKNWECAAKLNELAEEMDSAWRCRERQWGCTITNRNVAPEQKAKFLRNLLTWTEKNGYQENGLKILRTNWRKTSFKDEDIQYWEKRLQKTPLNNGRSNRQIEVKVPIIEKNDKTTEKPVQHDSTALITQIGSVEEAERVIQKTAGSFKSVSNVDTLSNHAADAHDLISAVQYKHADLSQEAILAIKEIIRFSIIFHQGVDEGTSQTIALAIRNNIEALREKKISCPFELTGLIEACERVAQHISVRIKSIPDLSITPPSDLKLFFGKPDADGAYLTRVCARLTNPSSETIEKIAVAFTSSSEFVHFPSEEVFIPSLLPADKCLAECPVNIKPGVEDNVEIRVYVVYEIRGIRRTVQNSCKVAVEEIEEIIPVTERYLTSRPVDVDRIDLFHGRSRELKDLMAAFSGERMRKLYFVNGIRRVGKSSLMQHLGEKYKENAVSILLNVETVLGGEEMSPIQFVRQLIRECIRQIKENLLYKNIPLTIPSMEKFELDTPWVVFDDFLEDVRRFTDKKNVLLCFDEIQRLVEKIADEKDPMNEGFLSWLRGKVQGSTGVLIVCTGSEPYSIMRDRHDHTLWANMEPYNVSFVNKEAAKKIASTPVEIDEVVWLPEALERLWDMTEGHPWIIQILAEKSCERINQDRRRLVMPSDVEFSADVTAMDDRVSTMWWNETNGLLTSEHRRVAFLIIQNQKKSRQGLIETDLAEICHRAGLRNIGNLLEEMKALEVISGEKEDNDMRWRIKGAYLEKHIAMLEQREQHENSTSTTLRSDMPLALMLDWENIKIELSKHITKLSPDKETALRERLVTTKLAKRLYEAAAIHGNPRQRWAVANWDNSFFQGDQADLRKNIRFETDMAGDSKADASDHVLRERIHEVLREHREISTYIIATGDADFLEAIRTLQKEGKRVILWSLRGSINPSYKYLLSGPDAITLEWLEDIIFES